MKRWISLSFLVALLGPALPAFSAGLIIVDEAHWRHQPPDFVPPPWPRPRPPRPIPIPRQHVFAPLEVNYSKTTVRITDQLAVTHVDQEFYNPNPARLEGTFVFPVPKGAHLDKFTMEIDGKQVSAELLAADKARGIYEDIVRKARDPALLEYSDRDLFKVRIFPIEPNSKKRVTLSYTQLLKSDDGLASYTLPLNTTRFSAKPIKNVSVKVELESNRPLKSIYSPSHAVEVKRDGANKATAGYEASDVQPDADFALYFAAEKDAVGISLLTHKPGGEDGYFLLLASPGVDVQQKNLVLKDVVFVLDTSGSMSGKKLEQAKKALLFCVENLHESDRFDIVRFSTEVEPLFDKLTDATKQNRTRAEEFIKDLKPIGGTAIDDALKKALALRPGGDGRQFVVIFLTDGKPTIGATDENQIVGNVKKQNEGRTRVFCFGIGTDVNTHLLDKITEETRAFSQYVLPTEDIEVKLSSFFTKIKEPVLANPTLKFTADVRVTKLYPSPLPDLFKGEQLVLVGRYTGKGDSAVVIEGTVNGQQRTFSHDVRFPDDSSENDFIPRLWATRRVGYLLDEIRLRGENSELKEEVTELARKHGIVTPYTAYLIVEDETRRGVAMESQSLRRLREDRYAYQEAEQVYRSFGQDKDGGAAVASARSSLALKRADNAPAALSLGNQETQIGIATAAPFPAPAFAGRGGGVPAQQPADAVRTKAQQTQQQQFAGGRTFYQNGNQWIDSLVQKQQNAKRVRIQFNSPEYFELIRKQPQALTWLALGQNVQFVLGDAVYEVFETN